MKYFKYNYRNTYLIFKTLVIIGLLLLSCQSSINYTGNKSPSMEPKSLLNLEPHFRTSVLRGWRYFQTSFAGDGLACVHCHLKHKTIRNWPGAYPKVEAFDGTPYRVKGLRQVVLEALEKHTDLPPIKKSDLVEDLVAYIAWWGDGTILKPGYSRPLPPASEDIIQLEISVEKGRRLFNADQFGPCGKCHETGEKASAKDKIPIGRSATTFPRYIDATNRVMSLQVFLSWMIQAKNKQSYSPESETITALAAYLVSLAEGERFHPGG